MNDFQGAAPSSLQEVSQILITYKGKISFICGGTDLVIKLLQNISSPDLVVDISQIPELQHLKKDGQDFIIGAGVPFSIISSHPLLAKTACGLVQAAAQVGSVQIRNRGTLGGNIAGQSPAADSIPPLLTLDAYLNLFGIKGSRKISLVKYLLEIGGGEPSPVELITAIGFPLPPSGSRSAFVKVGARSSVTKAKLSTAALVNMDSVEERIISSRFALGALGRNAFRQKECEDFLTGRHVTFTLLEEFIDLVVGIVEETILERASLPYKRVAIQGLIYDLFHQLWPAKFSAGRDGLF